MQISEQEALMPKNENKRALEEASLPPPKKRRSRLRRQSNGQENENSGGDFLNLLSQKQVKCVCCDNADQFTLRCGDCSKYWHQSCLRTKFGVNILSQTQQNEDFSCPDCQEPERKQQAGRRRKINIICCQQDRNKLWSSYKCGECDNYWHHSCLINLRWSESYVNKLKDNSSSLKCPDCYFIKKREEIQMIGNNKDGWNSSRSKVDIWHPNVMTQMYTYGMYCVEIGMWTEVGSCLNIASQLIDTRLKWIKEFSIKMLTKIEGGTAQSQKKGKKRKQKEEDDETECPVFYKSLSPEEKKEITNIVLEPGNASYVMQELIRVSGQDQENCQALIEWILEKHSNKDKKNKRAKTNSLLDEKDCCLDLLGTNNLIQVKDEMAAVNRHLKGERNKMALLHLEKLDVFYCKRDENRMKKDLEFLIMEVANDLNPEAQSLLPHIQQNIQEGIQFIDDNNSPVPILDVMSQYTNNPEIEVLEVENLSQRNKPTQKRKSMSAKKTMKKIFIRINLNKEEFQEKEGQIKSILQEVFEISNLNPQMYPKNQSEIVIQTNKKYKKEDLKDQLTNALQDVNITLLKFKYSRDFPHGRKSLRKVVKQKVLDIDGLKIALQEALPREQGDIKSFKEIANECAPGVDRKKVFVILLSLVTIDGRFKVDKGEGNEMTVQKT